MVDRHRPAKDLLRLIQVLSAHKAFGLSVIILRIHRYAEVGGLIFIRRNIEGAAQSLAVIELANETPEWVLVHNFLRLPGKQELRILDVLGGPEYNLRATATELFPSH